MLIYLDMIEILKIQILKTGFFHADPHPGNLAIDKDGSLIYYDFGMMGEIKSFTRERLLDLFYSVYEKDANKVYPLSSPPLSLTPSLYLLMDTVMNDLFHPSR
jgi:predicted unusual protein kinase regulating ubiquinone biosynthesis (AarF/ABC1/UbiB family)